MPTYVGTIGLCWIHLYEATCKTIHKTVWLSLHESALLPVLRGNSQVGPRLVVQMREKMFPTGMNRLQT